MTTALIFGVSGGIGRALGDLLHADGVTVLGVAREEPAVPYAVTSADFASEGSVAAACLWAAQQAGSVDLLVFAGGRMANGALADLGAEAYRRLWEDNVLAAQLVVRQATPLLTAEGHRVVLGAYVDKLAFPKLGAYASAKGAVDAWARVLLREERQVKTTYARLPAVDTALWKQAPFPLPRGALTPHDTARALVSAWREGRTGVVDVGG